MFVARNEKAQPSPPISPVSTIQLKLTTGPDNMAHSSISDKDGEPSSSIISGQVKWTVVCQAFVMFIVSIDSTILTTTLPTVASALGANSNESFWIAASYLLASASCQPVMATMADLCGRMAVSSAAVLLFTIGSVICSVASTVSQMLIGRTIQGIGGGGMTSLNLIILADLIPLRERSRYLGFIQLVFGLGTCLAPILGALLAERDWRWLFYINLPFCGIALIAVPVCLRRNPTLPVTQVTFATADWMGMAAFVTSITCFLVGLSWGGSTYPWTSFQTLFPIALGCVGVMATILYELYTARNPFLRKSLFQNRSTIISYCGTLQQGMMLFAASFFIPMYLMACRLYKPVHTGTAMLPLCLTLVPVSGVVGVLITTLGSYRWAVWSGWTLITIGPFLLTTLDLDTPRAIQATFFVCVGAGHGMLLMGHSMAVQASVKEDDAAHAAGMYTFLRTLGFSLGLLIGAAMVNSLLNERIKQLGLSISFESGTEGLVAEMQRMDDDAVQLQLRGAFMWALRRLFLSMGSLSGINLVCSAWIRREPLKK